MPAQSGPSLFPGREFGYPESGRGSIAGFGRRVAGIALDWAACMIVSWAFFSGNALATLGLFWAEYGLLVGTAGFSLGHRLSGLIVTRVDGRKPGLWRGVLRSTLLSCVVPALIYDENSRGGHDVLSGTVVRRR